MGCLWFAPGQGIEPQPRACALTRNRVPDLSVCRVTRNRAEPGMAVFSLADNLNGGRWNQPFEFL